VSFAFPGKAPLFRGLRFRVNTYSKVAIVGPNGAGKSTLLSLMTGALEPTVGYIGRYNKLRVGVYNQHFAEALPLDKTPIDYLVGLYDIAVVEARKYLGMFGLDGARHTIRIEQLSGGQKARVVLASLSLLRAHILVLDEPTNHLDIESVEALVAALRAYNGGIVLVTHDARLINAMECELWVCGDGPTGVRVETRGFERYKRDVLAEMAKAQEQAERIVAQKREARNVKRMRWSSKSMKHVKNT
jgi:ATP-binding cassette subfamily F protein 1